MATSAQWPAFRTPKMRPSKRQSVLPDTEEELSCVNHKRLLRAFAQAEARFVADWLLSSPEQTFLHRTQVPPTAFDYALAIQGTQQTPPPGAGTTSSLLLVPVALHAGKLIGYSFGGLTRPMKESSCPYGVPCKPIFPHFVGRFSFDISGQDLVIVMHGYESKIMCIFHIRKDGEMRERSQFIAAAGEYGHRRLPGQLLSTVSSMEKRKSWTPKYQFSVGGSGGGGSGDMRVMRDALARLERAVKGEFVCPKMRRDDMDTESGELLTRRTISVEAKFDIQDAIGLQVSKDQALRTYYSYMSSVSGAGSSRPK